MHGEPLVWNEKSLAWVCPEASICGTWVGVESDAKSGRAYAQVVLREKLLTLR